MRRILMLAALTTLAACSSGDGDGGQRSPPPGPRTASPLPGTRPPGMTSFAQTVSAQDGLGEVFPGQANTWTIDRDFSFARGWGTSYAFALAVYLGTPTSPPSPDDLLIDIASEHVAPFPWNQQVSEVTWLTPLFTAADGVRTADVLDGVGGEPTLAGTCSGYLNGTSDSRLYRAVTLEPGSSYRLSWNDRATLLDGALAAASSPPHASFYQVVLRSPASGEVLQQLFSETSSGAVGSPSPHDVELASTVAGPVQVSFELRSAAPGLAVVDDVVLSRDGVPVAGFDDGDFESCDLGSWSASGGAESQNVRSGARPVPTGYGPSLTVTRTFYAPPSATWARIVDVFENPSATRIVTSAVYWTTLLGSLRTIRPDGKAILGWDYDAELGPSSRNVAIVLGYGTALIGDASPDAFAVHTLDVPAGGKVALVHFVVQLGRAEGGATASDVPAGLDAEAAAIVAGFRADGTYVIDLEPGLLDLVRNF